MLDGMFFCKRSLRNSGSLSSSFLRLSLSRFRCFDVVCLCRAHSSCRLDLFFVLSDSEAPDEIPLVFWLPLSRIGPLVFDADLRRPRW